MGKTNKKSKLKGYGVYWSGDIKNKHIARKNKQYIRDQKYLHKYKKFKDQYVEQESSQPTERHTEPSSSLNTDFEAPNSIKPQVEVTYLELSDEESPTKYNDSSPIVEEPEDDDGYKESVDEGSKQRGNVYSKVLKKRREIEMKKKEEHDQRVEEIKKRKKEIRAKKQKRYERHRLLGARTKKGQPIMKNDWSPRPHWRPNSHFYHD
ncbi:conserved hypothetical protein [Theileria orientalis strain Shintoku]|uniref:rRNA-processing protein FYV7 n=1 Tax=Theileria orientalis strain Shintoku TaxID=869250 RepID=J4C8L7_THEOR|nr:conserved hypothetical protein [Theileria orientalis strain Shintoku]BAM41008.1 conserved hypothetical protein [Theileria orientalis strain Shintoku]|eukprot:XP_009691309.1 conserved hypothetical protein [Theileria orientalis strain Shintoku]